MNTKRPTNSELRLGRLDEEDSRRTKIRGILELFHHREPEPDEDAPLQRDDDAATRRGSSSDPPTAGISSSAEPPPPDS